MTTTPNYGGVLPLVGGDSGTWGTENNTLHNLWDSTIAATPRSYLAGLTLSTAGSSATFGVAVGDCLDSTNVGHLTLTSAYTKTTSAWSLGSAGGALDTGAIANSTWYHVHLIKRVDTSVTDVLVSLSATAPTLPTNYTLFRRIGSLLTDSSAHWQGFTQTGDLFLWTTPATDVLATTVGTSAFAPTLSVPPVVRPEAIFNYNWANSGNAVTYLYFNATSQTSVAADQNHSQVVYNSNLQNTVSGQLRLQANTASQIRVISSVASSTLFITTEGYIDRRGRDA
jgi:hypothetical protein